MENVAPPIPQEYLKNEVAYFEDEINRYCIKYNEPVICFCTDVSECQLIKECTVCNESDTLPKLAKLYKFEPL